MKAEGREGGAFGLVVCLVVIFGTFDISRDYEYALYGEKGAFKLEYASNVGFCWCTRSSTEIDSEDHSVPSQTHAADTGARK